MKVFGVDFTSRPRKAKPITCAECRFDGQSLTLTSLQAFSSFAAFEAWLATPGAWIAGLDFPFGQPRKLIKNLGWPAAWSAYMAIITGMQREEFVELLEDYKRDRDTGDKEHLRETDRLAKSASPQKLYNPPVGKMFYEGATRLYRSPLSIEPMRPTHDNRIVIEVYPALFIRRYIGRTPYKSDTRAKQTQERQAARIEVLRSLQAKAFYHQYHFHLALSQEFRDRLIEDVAGDELDAMICAVEAAWSWNQRNENLGIPKDANPNEGWIVSQEL
jgi:predicted RNase H-like nuclease